ncbi:hypothetical protein [Novosphingobium sp.]|uniref:hypothetical protein n=1 Tax=Novosphingobium sp. TaxID=1874826 RepID=UPI00286D9D37|nr:hypothetical protein [Novosphingobium sp.]
MSDAEAEQKKDGGSTRLRHRPDIRGPDGCADKLWRAALAKGKETDETFWFADGKPGDQRPSDWTIIFALKQIMVMPDFLRVNLGLDDTIERYSAPDIFRLVTDKVGESNQTMGNYSYEYVKAVLSRPGQKKAAKALASLGAHRAAYRNQITCVLNAWRVRAKGLGNLTADMLFDEGRTGVEAISQLRAVAVAGLMDEIVSYARLNSDPANIGRKDDPNWLEEPDSLEGKFAFAVDGGRSPRANQLNEAAEFLFGTGNGQALLNCHSEAMRGGLTALVAELFKPQHRIEHGCYLPMLYIPLHGRSCRKPDDSLGSLILRIRNFYASLALENDEPSPTEQGGKPARMNADRMNQLIAETRDLMTRYPAILVFDGYRTQRHSPAARDYSLYHLRAAIAADHVFDLIEQLLLIPTPEGGCSIDVETFRNTRFLITSDFPLCNIDDKVLHPHPVLRLITCKSIAIGLPPASAFPGILPKFGNQSPSQRVLIREEILGEKKLSVDQFQDEFAAHTKLLVERAQDIFGDLPGSEARFGVLSTLLELGLAPPYPSLGTVTEHDALQELIAKRLLPLLQDKHPDWLVLLHFIAIAPGGLRPRTLARVYEDYREVCGERLDSSQRRGLKTTIAAMLQACNGLIGLCRSDDVEALDDRDLPLLHRDRFGFGREEIASERAIMFALNPIRELFIAHACACNDGRYVSLLHLLLAEEAFDQCLQLSRYDDLHVDDSLLRHTRLLTGLYHGAASLIDDKMATAPLHPGAGRFLPDNPEQRWIKLYTFGFRKMLDRPPLHALIRHYDAAGLKLDLLLLLLKPQLWRWQESRSELTHLAPPLSKAVLGHEQIERNFRADILKASSKTLVRLDISTELHAFPGSDYAFRDWVERKIIDMPTRDDNRSKDVGEIPLSILARLNDDLAKGQETIEQIEALARLAQELVKGKDCAGELETLADGYAQRIATKRNTKQLKILADLINLYADATGVEADRLHGDVQVAKSGGYDYTVTEAFSRSFAAFYLGEAIRMRIFQQDPTKVRDTIGGSAGRGFIRVCLKLERQRQGWRLNQGFRSKGWFWIQAQKISAELTRYLSAYPRERAGMLILDSALARHCAPVVVRADDDENQTYLRMALASLRKCEPIIQKLSKHSRLRQRFALERSKVMEAMARLYQAANGDLALQYTDLAIADINSVSKLAPPQNQLWQSIAASQQVQLQELRQTLLELRRPGTAA